MAIYCYTKADQMTGHTFTDDVAITRAISKRRALAKFRKYYGDATIHDVRKIKVGGLRGVVILTDY